MEQLSQEQKRKDEEGRKETQKEKEEKPDSLD